MPTYQYIALPSPVGVVRKPWIRATLGYHKTHKVTNPIVALIDSGADVCFCDWNIGLWLGIDLKKKQSFTFTAANQTTFETKKENITLYICGKSYLCPYYFSDKLPHQTPIILGQIGFFDHFKVTFDVQRERIEIG